MEPLSQSVMVGVTGMGENTDALRFAVAEARTRDCGVTVVHAVHPFLPPPPPSVLITDDTWFEVGAHIVADVRRELDSMVTDDQLPIATVARLGDPGEVFSELSRDARLVVLQHRDLSRLRRIVTHSTVAAVATRAHCPVVSVPASLPDDEVRGAVVVGVHEDGGPRPVLEAAFDEAAARRSTLRIVHGWRLADGYDELLLDRRRVTAEVEARVRAALTDLEAKYPEVATQVEVRHDWPVDVLAEAAVGADLLVVGRHSGMRGLPHRLGATARAMVQHAGRPVMVVPT